MFGRNAPHCVDVRVQIEALQMLTPGQLHVAQSFRTSWALCQKLEGLASNRAQLAQFVGG